MLFGWFMLHGIEGYSMEGKCMWKHVKLGFYNVYEQNKAVFVTMATHLYK